MLATKPVAKLEHAALAEQAAALSRPPMTITAVLDLLAPNVPDFVAWIDAG
ncbi:MAG: hypothetical protein ACR2MK_02610 [Solirubrobacteraceae bacterium]